METKKRVYCLYRVSKPEQVDKVKDDLPMQKQACREFAERQGWEVTKEFYEKGISGFKVSSQKRDAIMEIQREAALGNFDILLVFMFDRLGRRDDETPFVVEWFIRNNIEVWSVNEGEQRLDGHVDKLLNYIRFWQASGESIKTSIRVKAAIAQLAQEGHYAGGKAPYGYRLEKCGRINTKGYDTLDFVIDTEAVDIVKAIFNLYVNEGYGAIRLTRYLHEKGITKSDGKSFSPRNVSQMIKNDLYIGYVTYGETKTYVPELKIIDDDIFKRAQDILKMRRKENTDERRIPMTTKGSTLLSGNIFCGECGRRMRADKYNAKSINKHGETTLYKVSAYACSTGYRVPGNTCQQRYSASKIDAVVKSVLLRVFEQIRGTPPVDCWERQHENTLSDIKSKIKTATRNVSKLEKELSAYKAEVIKVIQGNSAFTAEILNQLILDVEDKARLQNAELDQLKSVLDERDSLYENLKAEHTRIRSWAEIFEESSPETQKMVATRQCLREIKKEH